MKSFLYFVILCFSGILFSCNSKSGKSEDIPGKSSLSTEDLDKQLLACGSVAEVQSFLDKHLYLSKSYFTDLQIDSSQLANQLFSTTQNPDFKAFAGQIDSIIGNRETTIIAPLEKAFGKIRQFYPDFKNPAIKFIATGFQGNDLFISDSLIIIGLDYFGGPSAKYRPDVFDYQLRRYQKEYIVPSIIFFISNKYNHLNAADPSLLSEMIGYGKGYEFVKQILPETPDSLILGYSQDNLNRTSNSQQEIWSFFITNKLLYENNDLKKQKFIGERPFTTEIGNKVPGGIARWFGWRIIEKYMQQNTDVSLPELMLQSNAGLLLQESGYKGQKDEDE